jgi:RNA polymerase sigma-70 factor (ECF subfamily)
VNDLTDSELVIHLRTDEVRAFDTLYWRYHRALYSNIIKLTKDAEAAQDILQEVFITLWEKRLTLDPDQAVINWLFTVSYHKSVNYLKKMLKAPVISSGIDEEMHLSDEQEINLKETQLILLEKAVTQLSPQKRKVFELCKLQGKSYEETARELNISKHTVKEYLSEAIFSVREYMKRHPDYPVVLIYVILLTLHYS